MIPLNIIPTGWFHIGWTDELPPGGVKPLNYFGQELVAFRSETGELSIMDAFCPHLGAHLGYGGKVKDDCIVCPYHGWEWNTKGQNTVVPYQDQPVKKAIRTWHTIERHGMMFIWYDPEHNAPKWELLDPFKCFPGGEVSPDDYYPCYPHATFERPNEPFPAQYMMENAADSAHFQFTHGAPMSPKLTYFSVDEGHWIGTISFKSPKTDAYALSVTTVKPNIGLAFAHFNGKPPLQYRLALTATPIDAFTCDVRLSYFLQRDPKSPDVMPDHVLKFAETTEELYEEDARMWRRQKFMQKPIFAAQDVEGYSAYRKWCERFYEGHAKNPSTRGLEAYVDGKGPQD